MVQKGNIIIDANFCMILQYYFAKLQGKELPIYIWYDNYPTHADKEYEGRVSIVKPGGTYYIVHYTVHFTIH